MPPITPDTILPETPVQESVPQGSAPNVTGDQLLNPPEAVGLAGTFEAPRQNVNTGIVDNVSNEITAQEQALQKANEVAQDRQDTLAALGGQSFGDIRSGLQQDAGVFESNKQLKDIQLQLAQINTKSGVTKERIKGAAGQTLGQAGRELTQEDRENAIRSAGLAAQASVLQGNIETARTLINDAMSDVYAERQTKLNIAEKQLDRAFEVADEKEKQLLTAKKAEMDAENARIQEVKDAVSEAVLSGAATQQEVQAMQDLNATDEDRLALAQSIQARGAGEERGLDLEAQRANIAQSRASTANSLDAIEQRAVAASDRKLALEQGGAEEQEVEQAQKEVDAEKALNILTLATELKTTPGGQAAVGAGFGKFFSDDPIAGTERADFVAKAERLGNLMTLDNLKLMSGVLSETDIKILASAGSSLNNFDQTEGAYKEEVLRVIDTVNRVIENNGVTTEQAKFYYGATDEDLSEVDSIFSDTTNSTTQTLLDNDTF